MPQLTHQHRVPQVQVRRGRIEPRLHAQRGASFAAILEALTQILDANNLRRTLLQQVHLLIYWKKRSHSNFEYITWRSPDPATAGITAEPLVVSLPPESACGKPPPLGTSGRL